MTVECIYNPKIYLNLKGEKNGLVVSIAPLQLLTLAAFPPWGSSEGAGRR